MKCPKRNCREPMTLKGDEFVCVCGASIYLRDAGAASGPSAEFKPGIPEKPANRRLDAFDLGVSGTFPRELNR